MSSDPADVRGRPGAGEAAPYYFSYIDQIRSDDVVDVLDEQRDEALALFQSVTDDRSLYRYAADKWSVREVLAHINDCERLSSFRAFWFARGFDAPLPSFDQTVAAATANADARSWPEIVDEFRAVRAATLSLFRSLPPRTWARRGIASDNPFTVRALAYITAGHVAHHIGILKERYR